MKQQKKKQNFKRIEKNKNNMIKLKNKPID